MKISNSGLTHRSEILPNFGVDYKNKQARVRIPNKSPQYQSRYYVSQIKVSEGVKIGFDDIPRTDSFPVWRNTINLEKIKKTLQKRVQF